MAKNNKISTEAYTGDYSDESFMDKVKRVGQKMGGKLLFNAFVLYYVLKSQERLLNGPDFNFVIRSAPTTVADRDYHWYISIIPRLTKTAGFEIGSNIYINCSLPEHNALELRNVVDTLREG